MGNKGKLILPSEIFAVFIALIALFVSIRSCFISEDALNLSESDFYSSRSLVLTADFPDGNEKVIFKPHSDKMKLVTLGVYTPSKILDDGVELTQPFAFETSPPGDWTYLEGIKETISKHHLKKDCEDKPGNIMIIARIPVIVETSYLAENTRLFDTSIYDFKYVFYRGRDRKAQTKFSAVLLDNLEFVSHINPKDAERMKKDLFDGKPLIIKYHGEQDATVDADKPRRFLRD